MLANELYVADIAEWQKCSKKKARDHIEQVNYFFYLKGEPMKGMSKDGRFIKIPEESVQEFLEATKNNWYPMNKWREPIRELVENM